jgi:hypothetical protein
VSAFWQCVCGSAAATAKAALDLLLMECSGRLDALLRRRCTIWTAASLSLSGCLTLCLYPLLC